MSPGIFTVHVCSLPVQRALALAAADRLRKQQTVII